ncbi:MAG: lipid-binding SYLF domain-containing protein [Syntrophobacteraceae bacterium]
MKKQLLWPSLAFLTLFLCGLSATLVLAGDESSIVGSAVKDLKTAVHSKSISSQELQQSYGLAIIPSYWKAALVGGWQHGVGVLMVKTGNNTWSDPVFISASGGSLGAQVGFVSGDMIMFFKDKRDVDKIMNGKFRLSPSATTAVKPGEKSQPNTNASQVSTYVDTSGGFIGAAAEGVEISVEQKSNATFYGDKKATAKTITAGTVKVPKTAQELQKTAEKLSAS